MANVKISALTSATFVNDADFIPIVQSGVTKKVTPAILLENLWAETTAINGLIDGILGAPATASLYTASGTLFNNGIAKTKDFLFKTSDDGSYNPSGTYHEMRFNASYNDSGGYSTSPGWFGMKGAGINNKLAVFNMYGGGTPTLEMFAVDTVVARTRTLQLSSDSLYLGTETTTGAINLQFGDTGAVVSDFRSTPLGITYNGNYSSTIIANDRAVPDVGTVKSLITANATSIYTASGNVFDTGLATTRRFGFITDQDVTYNPTAAQLDIKFNYYMNNISASSAQPGAFGIRVKNNGDNEYVTFNMYSAGQYLEMVGSSIAFADQRKFFLSAYSVQMSTGTATGQVEFTLNSSGAILTDSRTGVNSIGMTYNADYSTNIIVNDRSITDTGSVKKLRQQANTWTTGTRPTAVAGVFGLNTTTSKFEGYTGSAWVDFH